jgi:hypothetical protein
VTDASAAGKLTQGKFEVLRFAQDFKRGPHDGAPQVAVVIGAVGIVDVGLPHNAPIHFVVEI